MEYFIINTAVAGIYKDPTHQSEMVTQAIFGENCMIIEKKNDWIFIQQWDNYKGWVYSFNGLESNNKYNSNYTLQDINGKITINKNGAVATNLVFGAKVKAEKIRDLFSIDLPNGNKAYSDNKFLSKPVIASRENIINIANKFIGTPYLWGGKSSYGMDCSGLVQTVFKTIGLKMPRDAYQQAKYLQKYKVEKFDLKAGDLIFFGENEHITHVGISLGGLNFINARGCVQVESIDEKNSVFSRKLADLFLYGVSITVLLNNDES